MFVSLYYEIPHGSTPSIYTFSLWFSVAFVAHTQHQLLPWEQYSSLAFSSAIHIVSVFTEQPRNLPQIIFLHTCFLFCMSWIRPSHYKYYESFQIVGDSQISDIWIKSGEGPYSFAVLDLGRSVYEQLYADETGHDVDMFVGREKGFLFVPRLFFDVCVCAVVAHFKDCFSQFGGCTWLRSKASYCGVPCLPHVHYSFKHEAK